MRALSLLRFFLLLLAPSLAAALPPDQLFEKVSPSVYVVHTYDKTGKRLALGSGVVVARERVVTNCHVLAKSASVRVSHGNANFGATLEWPDVERDLCQLKVKDLPAAPVALGSTARMKVGQRIFAIGSPSGLENTLSDGLVASLRGEDGETPLIQITAPISPGSSGGGLFNENGELVGITTFGSNARQIYFAHPVDWVRELPTRGAENIAKMKAKRTATASAAGGDPNLPAGMPHVGDSWTYVGLELAFSPNEPKRKVTHTIRSVSKGTIVESAGGRDYTFDSSLSGVMRSTALVEVAPYALAFGELKTGASFGAVPVENVPVPRSLTPLYGGATGANDKALYIDGGQVIGPEKITIRAGTFDTIVVRYNARLHKLVERGNGFGYSEVTYTVWYAPSVKRAVKTVLDGARYNEAYELESYKLQ